MGRRRPIQPAAAARTAPPAAGGTRPACQFDSLRFASYLVAFGVSGFRRPLRRVGGGPRMDSRRLPN